jgi:glycosyltransferase involved in cell wall biosynthesis
VLGVPFSFSAHARDIRKVPRGELTRRARAATCVVACNTDVADDLGATGARVELIPHGVDLRRFTPTPPPCGEPLELLAVGRLVEKKGLGALLEAVAGLETPFRLRIVGDGPLRGALERSIADAGLHDRATLDGTLTHRELPDAYAGANVVVVPSVQDAGGDRDGLPNVVLEAMASARPVVASEMAAIPAAVRDGDTGLLVPPGDPRALRAALERLARDPALRAGMGVAARRRVERDFELGRCTRRLLDCLRDAYA